MILIKGAVGGDVKMHTCIKYKCKIFSSILGSYTVRVKMEIPWQVGSGFHVSADFLQPSVTTPSKLSTAANFSLCTNKRPKLMFAMFEVNRFRFKPVRERRRVKINGTNKFRVTPSLWSKPKNTCTAGHRQKSEQENYCSTNWSVTWMA